MFHIHSFETGWDPMVWIQSFDINKKEKISRTAVLKVKPKLSETTEYLALSL